jgi:uncharacterized protein DUF6263
MRFRHRACCLLTLLALSLPASATAQTLLRWKLKPGDSLALQTRQEIQSQVAFSGKSATTTIDLNVQLTWNVTAADENQITLKQTIEQIQLKLATPQGAAVDFDSAGKARVTGQARDLAEVLKPLIGAEFDVVINIRGEIIDAKPSNDAAKALVSTKDKTNAADSSRAAVEQLLRKPLIVLPAAEVKAGDRWTAANDLTTAAGPLRQEIEYQLTGMTEQDGKQLHTIAMTSKLASRAADTAGSPTAKMSVKSFEQAGTIVFSAGEGRVVEAEQSQKLGTERTYRETTIVVTLTSTRKTTVKPKQ